MVGAVVPNSLGALRRTTKELQRAESTASALEPVLAHAHKMVGIEPGPQTPEGVYARVVDGRTLYVNTTGQQKRIPIVGQKKGIITNRVYDGTVILEPQEADLIQ